MVYVKFDEMFIGRTHREKLLFPGADCWSMTIVGQIKY